jgi:tRNA nucleotidyltransferase (CCA-adding enzyme)
VTVAIDTRVLRNAIPQSVLDICQRLLEHGHAAWIVGGCVRDQLMQVLFPEQPSRPPGDWDIATSALPETVQKLFPKVIPTGLEHGTVTVLMHKVPYEVTTFRAEAGYVDGRRPGQVVFLDDIAADLSRRDFTVNAIAYDPLADKLEDPYAGIDDLRSRILRAVGNPSERFAEDGLRVLRAARFMSTLEFTLDPATAEAIEPSLDSYRKVSAERIRDEWLKALVTRKPSLAFDVMARHGLLDITIPELTKYTASQEWARILQWVNACPARTTVRLAALLSPLTTLGNNTPHPTFEVSVVDQVLTRLRLSNQDRNRVLQLLTFHLLPAGSVTAPALRRWLRAVGTELVPDLFALVLAKPDLTTEARLDSELAQKHVRQVLAETPALSVKDLAVDGKTLMTELGLPPGKHIGQLLQHLLEVVTDDPESNTREALLRQARSTPLI